MVQFLKVNTEIFTNGGAEPLEADHPDHLVGADHLAEPLQVHLASHSAADVSSTLQTNKYGS